MTAKPAKPVAPRSRLRWLLRAAAGLLVIALLSPLLLGLGPVRGLVETKASDALGRRVTIDGVSAFWFKGLDLEGITVASPDGFDTPLATIEHVHVDLDLLAILGGRVDADIKVTKPHVTLARRGDRSNLEGLGKKREVARPRTRDEKRDKAPSQDRIALVVHDGVIETRGVGGTGSERIENILLLLDIAPDTLVAKLSGEVPGAGQSGGDGKIGARLERDASGAGPFDLAVPPLDLGRLAPLIEALSGVRVERGRCHFIANGTLGADGAIDGVTSLGVQNLAARLADGTHVVADGIEGSAQITHGDDVASGSGRLVFTNVAVIEPAAEGGRRFEESKLELNAEGRYDAAQATLDVASAKLDAGRALVLKLTTPWQIGLGETLHAKGDARIDADFAHLGSLRALFPSLSRLRSGTAAVNLRALGGERLGISASAGIGSLVLDPLDEGAAPYREARIVLQARWQETDASTSRLDVYKLQSALASSTDTSLERPFTLYFTDAGLRMDGPIGLRADLDALSRLSPSSLGLEPGERVRGVIDVSGKASGTTERATVEALVRGRDILFPPRIAGQARPAAFDANLNADVADDRMTVSLERLRGMGLSGTGLAELDRTADGPLQSADLDLTIDLGRARPWVVAFLDLDAATRMSGVVATKLTARTEEAGLRVTGRTNAADLRWQGAGGEPLHEPSATAAYDVLVASEGGRDEARQLEVAVGGLTADLSGSSVALGPDDPDITLSAKVTGDAARLAPTLRRLLGPDYADLTGQGPISGQASINGSLRDGGRDLLVDLRLEMGSWATGGLELQSTVLTARRAGYTDPLATGLTSTVNGGPATVDLRFDLQQPTTPWTLALRAEQVDTAGVLVGQGLGEYLTFALPSILPASSDVPVLSGRLDVTADLSAQGIEDPLLSRSLAGTAVMAMREGEVRDSTLFGKGRGGFDDITKMIAVAVPEVGRALVRVSEALVFSTVDSKLRIADEVVHVEQASLVGRDVKVGIQGRVTFEERIDLDTRVQLQGKNGRRLGKYLEGGVIPLRVRGTLEKPRVKAAFDAKALAVGGLLDDLLGGGKKGKKSPLDRLKDLIK